MAETQHSVRIVKKFQYRDDIARQFSNRYYFDGGAPADAAAWHDLMDALVLLEKTIFNGAVTIIAAHGYEPGSKVAVANKEYTTVGTLVSSAGEAPGDCCAVVRWATSKRSKKNHPVYVFSYYHNALIGTGHPTGDWLDNTQKTAIDNYANDWLVGIVVGSRTYKRTTPDGVLVTGRLVDTFIGHRDFLD